MVVRKPAAKTAATRPATARKAAPAKPVARKAAPAPAKRSASVSEARREQLAEARAKRGAKPAAPAVHPAKKEAIPAHDVLRAFHTFATLYVGWLGQQGEEVSEVLDFVAPILAPKQGAPRKTPLTKTKVSAQEREEEQRFYDRDETENLPIKELREIAVDLAAAGIISETKVKRVILEQMEEAGLFRAGEDDAADEDASEIGEDADEEEEDEDESDEEDESDDDTENADFTREELAAMKLKQLQELAEYNEIDWEGLGKAELIDALLPEDEEEEDEEEEEEDEEEEDEEEEDEGGYIEIDPAALKKMSVEDLLGICTQAKYDVPAKARKNKQALIEIILENMEDEEEEEDEDE